MHLIRPVFNDTLDQGLHRSGLYNPIVIQQAMEEQTIDFQGRQPRPPRRNHTHGPGRPKQKMVMVYTVAVILSCLYLETQHFQFILDDKKAHYMALLTYLDVFMCLWSYIQTIRIGNSPAKLSKLGPQPSQTEKFKDQFYSPVHKYCTICNNYKFPRVNHCSTCGTCQYKMDHHCVWTQTCIGFRNQKSFYLFCLYMSLGVMQFWYFTYRVLSEGTTVPLLALAEPGVIILWAFTTFSVFFVGIMIVVLCCSHTVMMFTNYRTLDAMKQKQMCPLPFIDKGRSPDQLNVFDRGQLQNLKQFLGPNLWLWWMPTAREPENEIYPEPLCPHPDPFSLLRDTNLYEVQLKYKQEMRRMHKINFLPFFVGKKMRINGGVYLIEPEENTDLSQTV